MSKMEQLGGGAATGDAIVAKPQPTLESALEFAESGSGVGIPRLSVLEGSVEAPVDVDEFIPKDQAISLEDAVKEVMPFGFLPQYTIKDMDKFLIDLSARRRESFRRRHSHDHRFQPEVIVDGSRREIPVADAKGSSRVKGMKVLSKPTAEELDLAGQKLRSHNRKQAAA